MSKYNRVSPTKVIMIILIVLMVVAAAGLGVFIYSDSLRQDNINSDVDQSFIFGTCNGNVNDVSLTEELVSVKGMANYNGETSLISSDYYLEQLRQSGADKAIALYKAMIYAYNNDFNFISIPSALYDEDTMIKAVYYANCDLPIMDLNAEIGSAESSITTADGTVSKRYFVYMPTCSKNHLTFKREAVAEAKRVIDMMPDTVVSEMQKAEYLHEWLVLNVKYTADLSYGASNPYFLYDTLVGRVSNSDGIARTYTLLLNLCGVEAFTVYRAEGGGKVAHSWNIFKVNGDYYQADVTHDINVYSLGLGNLKLHLALSAEGMGNGEYHRIIRDATPACTQTNRDQQYIDAVVPDTDAAYKDAEGMVALRKKLEEGADYVTIRCPKFTESQWEQNFKVISRWFADTKVSFKVSNAGSQTVVLYTKK